MKNKIVAKLTGYFTVALLIFSVIISLIFLSLFKNNTIELQKSQLQQRAVKISENLSNFFDENGVMNGGMRRAGGYGAYIKFLNDIAMTDVWIVDEDLNILTPKHNMEYTISELPENAEEIVKEVFKGKISFSESFSSLFDTPMLTVGTPIKLNDRTVVGVVLLHSPINGIDTAVKNGYTILAVSIGIALVIALLLSFRFSLTFTKPLKIMNNTAIELADGNYSVKTDIIKDDEIGELAKNLDILSQKLYDASKESERLEQLRNDFVANISHELRTPITVIRGSLEALNDGVISEHSQVQEYYKQMLSESKSLQRLVGDLLDLSRLQNVDFKIEMTRQNILDILHDVIRSGKNIAQSKDIAISFENTAINTDIVGDYGRLRQMFMVILDNAIKFSPNEGHIDIKLYGTDSINVSIRDYGQGIPKEDLPYIFDRFYKTKSAQNKNGTGLGLAIAKQIALRHNANIAVESENGCVFKIEFLL